ncbi:glia maturation factor, beta, isoform CRA_a [Paraphysoderma sedebokerense]|nr:glia maturation factor, beta, isoform CRA_a [Paraphysoderma sedebokerense]
MRKRTTVKIDRNNLLISVDQELPKTTIDEIVEELPENIPRYVIISYEWTHNDGRKSYPLVFLYWSPLSTKPEQHMLYASAKLQLQQAVDLNSKVYEIRNPAELTEQWLIDRLNGKRQ